MGFMVSALDLFKGVAKRFYYWLVFLFFDTADIYTKFLKSHIAPPWQQRLEVADSAVFWLFIGALIL